MHRYADLADILGDNDSRHIARCMHHAGISREALATDPRDGRRRLLTEEQFARIQRAYADLYGLHSPDPLAELWAAVARLADRLDALEAAERPVTPPTAQLSIPAPHRLPASLQRVSEASQVSSAIPPLPEDWTTFSRWLREHSRRTDAAGQLVPFQEQTMRQHASRGHLPLPQTGQWREPRGGQTARYAYDPDQHIAASIFAAQKWPEHFRDCSLCRQAVREVLGLVIEEEEIEAAEAITVGSV